MNTKVDEGKLISGKEAKKAWANKIPLEYTSDALGEWFDVNNSNTLGIFERSDFKFRFAPRTITINGIEAPSIKKESAIYRSNDTVAIVCESFEDAELMCLALRQVFGGSHDN